MGQKQSGSHSSSQPKYNDSYDRRPSRPERPPARRERDGYGTNASNSGNRSHGPGRHNMGERRPVTPRSNTWYTSGVKLTSQSGYQRPAEGEGRSPRGNLSHNLVVDNTNKITSVYKMAAKLGEGSYGSVCKATEIKSGATRAVKTISKSGVQNMDKFLLEVHLMKMLDHPNVIKLFETFQDSRNIYLVMEVCNGGELFSRILDAGNFNERDAAGVVKQILNAVFYLHSHNIAHRDLKPENFLFTEKGLPLRKSMLKIIDFGLSCFAPKFLKYSMKRGGLKFAAQEYKGKRVIVVAATQPALEAFNNWHVVSVDNIDIGPFCGGNIDKFLTKLDASQRKKEFSNIFLRYPEGTLTTKAGTPYYVAPEVLGDKHGIQCDIWSTGVIMYILLCGYPPFHGGDDRTILRKVVKGQYTFPQKDWCNISGDAKDLINSMLKLNPKSRITAYSSLQHVWISSLAPNYNRNNNALQDGFVTKLRGFRQQNKLKKVALFAVAANISDKQVEQMRHIFQQLDRNGDGELTFDEISKGLSRAGIEVDNEVKEILLAIDSDSNGRINYTEFISATMSQQQATREDLCWQAFRIFDSNGDGIISKHELASAIKSRERGMEVLSAEDKKAIMQDVDKNGDGQIDFHEFMEMMRSDN